MELRKVICIFCAVFLFQSYSQANPIYYSEIGEKSWYDILIEKLLNRHQNGSWGFVVSPIEDPEYGVFYANDSSELLLVFPNQNIRNKAFGRFVVFKDVDVDSDSLDYNTVSVKLNDSIWDAEYVIDQLCIKINTSKLKIPYKLAMTLDSIMSLKMNSIDNTSKEFIISADNIKIYYYQRNGKRKMYDNSIVSMSNSNNIT